ncbi:MAG: hypothetical protein H0U44_08805, partial [Flavisolibacter sp.]|nr:hypothetical protein [Flavisolibacter sp.]
MKKLFNVLFILYCCFPAEAQNPFLITGNIDHYPAAADEFVGRDHFGGFYFISDNTLSRLQGGKTLDYKNISKGKIAHVDIQNPLLILVFYQSFNTVILLDGQLNEVREINLNQLESPVQAVAAGLASQNRIWLFDALQQQIIIYDYNQNTYRSISTPLLGILQYYQTDFNTFYWINESGNRFSCD